MVGVVVERNRLGTGELGSRHCFEGHVPALSESSICDFLSSSQSSLMSQTLWWVLMLVHCLEVPCLCPLRDIHLAATRTQDFDLAIASELLRWEPSSNFR